MRIKALFLVAAMTYGLPAGSSAQERPVREYPVFTNYAPPPTTLGGLAKEADAVVVTEVRRLSSREEHTPGASRTSVLTDYSLNIVEVIKPHPQVPPAGSPITISRAGGDVIEADHVRRSVEVDFPRFKPGERYLLFLRLNPASYRFEILYGPNGSYRIVNGKMQPLGRSELASKVSGKLSEHIVAELRAVASR
jgi:hypothetical protein